jgi:hypothetical protein
VTEKKTEKEKSSKTKKDEISKSGKEEEKIEEPKVSIKLADIYQKHFGSNYLTATSTINVDEIMPGK